VVILLGANDFNTTPHPSFATFSSKLNALIDEVQLAYSQRLQRIVVLCGPLERYCPGE
jgi:hypothetical protein